MLRKRLLIVGCGDVCRRALARWLERYDVAALSRRSDEALAARGVRLYVGDLDRPETLGPLAGAADLIVHSAPPPDTGPRDTRTRALVAALDRSRDGGGMLPQRLVYISTSGVYGDCAGDYVDESRPLNPQTGRAARRADAEAVLGAWCRERGVALAVLRAPGIYAADRLPVERIRRGTPVLSPEDDVYTNHIHAEDLATIVDAALSAGSGAYNASDDGEMKMGEYFDLVADRMGLPRPPRVRRADAAGRIHPELLSFMSESRRLVNRRMKAELSVRLRYPTVHEGVPRGQAVAE